MSNCKNCGAPRTGDKCEYCGTKTHASDIAAIRSETERLKTQMFLEQQNNAIIAALNSNIITPNEARRIIYDQT